MSRAGQLIILLVLTAFLASSFVPARLWDQNRNSVERSIEDVQDTTDAEDEVEDNDEFKEKETSHHEFLMLRSQVSIVIAHQTQVFSNHHPSVITPPPRG